MPHYIKNILHTQFFSILNIIIGLISLFFLIKYLHVEEYGQYVLIQGFVAFVGLIISQNINSYTRLKIPGNPIRIQYGYLKTVVFLVLGFYLFIFCFIFLLNVNDLFWNFFEIKTDLSLIVIVILGLELINSELIRFFISIKNIYIKNYALFLQKFFVSISLISLFFLDLLFLKNFLLLYIAGQIMVFLYFLKNIDIKNFINAPLMIDVIRKGYLISLPLFPIGLMSLALNYTDTFMIAKMIDYESAAKYGLVSQIVFIIFMLIEASIILTLFPYATEAYNVGDYKTKNDFILKMYFYSILMSIIIYIILMLNITWFLNFLNLDNKYVDTPLYLLMMGIFPLFQSIYSVSSHNIQILRVIKIQLYLSVFVIFINIFLNFIFIKIFGIIGAIYASTISYIILSMSFFIVSLKHDYLMREYFKYNLNKILLYVIVFSFILVMLNFLDKNIFLYIILCNLLILCIFILILSKMIKNFRKK